MLPGVARKIAIPFILLSIAGFALFGVGFGLRYVSYGQKAEESTFSEQAALNNAAKPEFFLFWAFAVSGLLVYVMSFVHTCWDHNASSLLMNMLLPLFMLGGGGVMLADGLNIYHYIINQNNGLPLFFCSDVHHFVINLPFGGLNIEAPDITGDDNYIPIEFAGVAVAMLFYWIFLMTSSFFVSNRKIYA